MFCERAGEERARRLPGEIPYQVAIKTLIAKDAGWNGEGRHVRGIFNKQELNKLNIFCCLNKL